MEESKELQVEVGKRIRALRKARGMTMAALAEAAETSVQYLSEIEHGKKSMTLNKLRNMALALGVTTDYLIFGVRRGAGASTEAIAEVVRLLEEMTPLDRELTRHMLEQLLPLLRLLGSEEA